MMQYMLSVPMIDGAPPRPPAETQEAFEQVARLNEELRSAGAWVFGGGLLPSSSATVVRGRGPRVHGHRRALHRVQGAHRWLLGHCGGRPRCGARMGQEGHPRLWRARRGAAVPGGSSGLMPAGPTAVGEAGDRAHLPAGVRAGGLGADPGLRRHRSGRGRGAGRLHRRRAAVARGRSAPEPRRLDHHHGTPADPRPAATRGLPGRPPDPGRRARRPGRRERRNSPCGTTAFA